MKKRILIVSLLLIIGLIGGCKQSSDSLRVSIAVDRETYTTLLSSVQGITLSPELSTELIDKEVVYEWIASDGNFIKTMSRQITNNGDPLLWNPINSDSTSAVGTTTIKLNVRDKKTNDILARATLRIEFDYHMYRVKK